MSPVTVLDRIMRVPWEVWGQWQVASEKKKLKPGSKAKLSSFKP
jgi:hypothetical protein